MGWYEAIKDAINIAKKANNIEVMQSLIDAQQQMLEMQKELELLREENKQLLNISIIEEKIVRHKATVITLDDDKDRIPYCSCCWDKEKKLIQLKMRTDGTYRCGIKDCDNTAFNKFYNY